MIVMGNEAGGGYIAMFSQPLLNFTCQVDLDTIASSVAYSWIQSEVHKRPSVPLIRFKSTDLKLRKENIYALALSGLTAHELLYCNDLDPSAEPAHDHPFPATKFALVDHNRLAPQFTHQNPAARVVAVIDHHANEGLYKDTADPRIVALAGSCASHIARLCPPDLPAELATLLLCAILIDTNGLKPGGKALEVDHEAASFLIPRSTFAAPDGPHQASEEEANIQHLTTELNATKADVSDLSAYDLLRRDYKQSTYTLLSGTHTNADPPLMIDAGLSSVPLRLSSWTTEGRLAQSVEAFMDDMGLIVLGILTSFRDQEKGKNKHRREQLWIVRSAKKGPAIDVGNLSKTLWNGLEESEKLKLKRYDELDTGIEEGEMVKVRAYKQTNADATRKVTAPLLEAILEGPRPKSA
jgi:exopolyphosphatase